jgi:hypothetical protein
MGLPYILIIDLMGYLAQCAESLLFELGVMGFCADQGEVAGSVLGTKLRSVTSTIYHLRIIIISLSINLM